MKTLARVLDIPVLFYAARFLLVGRQRALKRFLAEHLSTGPHERLLDVCCGVGEFAETTDAQYVGVDLNPMFIEHARRKHRGSSSKVFEVGDVTCLRFPDRRFDKAMIVNSLHHFSDEEAVRLLTEVRRVTRRLVVVVDADGTPGGIVSRALVQMDRGKFMRRPDELSKLVDRVFRVEDRLQFRAGLYTEVLLRCRVDAGE